MKRDVSYFLGPERKLFLSRLEMYNQKYKLKWTLSDRGTQGVTIETRSEGVIGKIGQFELTVYTSKVDASKINVRRLLAIGDVFPDYLAINI